MKSVLFSEQYFYPEGWGGSQLPRDLTTHLASLGYRVTVLCGSDPYVKVQGDPGPDPSSQGVLIVRVPRLLRGEARQWRVLRQLWFYTWAFGFFLFRRPPDLFIAQTNPPLTVVLVSIAARIYGRPYMLIAQDLYPEALVAHGSIRENGLAAAMLGRVFAYAYRGACQIVSLGGRMTHRLYQKGVAPARVTVISNWSTGADGVVRSAENRLRKIWALESKFVLLYSGNLGIGHEFETLVNAVSLIADQVPQLQLVIVGRGGRLEEVKATVARRGLERRVQFHDFVPASQLPESLGVADVAVVTLRPGFDGLIVPSKVLGYMARGLPVLFIGPAGDTSEILHASGCGVSFGNGDARRVADWLLGAVGDPACLARMGASGAAYYERELSRERALARYGALVSEVMQREAAP